MVDCYIGEIRMIPYGRTMPPVGWAFCDGSLINIADNQTLFALLGTTYGGDGVKNFGLPDYRSRIPIGAGQGTGLTTNYPMGGTGGQEAISLTAANIPAHTHTWSVGTGDAMATAAAGNWYGTVPLTTIAGRPAGGLYFDTTHAGWASHNMDSGVIGGTGNANSSHENRMPTRALQFIIALQGIYPVRA